jgi:hypothetical protein
MEPELPGENSSHPVLERKRDRQRRRGRPSEIDSETLQRAVTELQFALEQNWGVAGWLLRQAREISEVRIAFQKIENPKCRFLELFTQKETKRTTGNELRRARQEVKNAELRFRDNFAALQRAQDSCERVFYEWVAHSDPVKKAQIQSMRSGLAHTYEEAQLLERASRLRSESLRTELKEREAYFAQSEILRFIQSNRREFTPLNIARAMAGIPFIAARVSCERCSASKMGLEDSFELQKFQIIERVLVEPITNLESAIERLRKRLLMGRGRHLPSPAELRANWYFLESAVRSAACDFDAPHGSLAFRVFAKYGELCRSRSPSEEIRANAQRLILDGEKDREGMPD